MIDVRTVGRETFAAFEGQEFQVSDGDLSFAATLIEISAMGETPGPDGRRAFSIVFRGPATGEPSQQVYRVEHPEAGSLELFLVPIGPDEQGMKYEAVFT